MNVKKKINKKERRNIKNKKRELRRRKQVQHNQENSKVSSNNIPKYSPIKFDRFRRVCSLVNREGDVLPTDTEMFGCEIVRDLPNYIRDFVKQMGLGQVIRVPVSNHDYLTGSGKKGRCDMNSNMLSLSIGGNRLYGYNLHQTKKTSSSGKTSYSTWFHHHSVWNTPEGKTRCVTDYDLGESDTERLFIPAGLNLIEETFSVGVIQLGINSSHNYVDYMKKGIPISRRKIKDVVRYRKDTGDNVFLGNTILGNTGTDLYWKEEIENSYFSKVSSTTGRSWDYFKNKILNTYFPTSLTLKTPKIVI